VRQSSSTLLTVAAPEETQELGRKLGRALLPPGTGALVIGIEGELGAGKTTLVKGVLNGLGITGAVRSPTYTLIEPYDVAGLHLYHVDLYRLTDSREVDALGMRDLLHPAAVLLIEWPSRAAGALPALDLHVLMQYQPSSHPADATRRVVTFTAGSSAGHKLVEQVLAAMSE
jgi:tRNA threonylcarbamoyladenosine biosynthesis protein TsaE